MCRDGAAATVVSGRRRLHRGSAAFGRSESYHTNPKQMDGRDSVISRPNLFRTAAGIGLLSATQSVGLAANSSPAAFDRKEFERRIALDYRHRQVFAASHLDLGSVLHYIQNSLNAYADPDGFAEGPGTLHAAAVFYGASISTVLNDDMWNRFNLGPFFTRFGERVPVQSGADRKSPFSETATGLRAHGVSFFVCRNALHDIAGLDARGRRPVQGRSLHGAIAKSHCGRVVGTGRRRGTERASRSALYPDAGNLRRALRRRSWEPPGRALHPLSPIAKAWVARVSDG